MSWVVRFLREETQCGYGDMKQCIMRSSAAVIVERRQRAKAVGGLCYSRNYLHEFIHSFIQCM